jgi:predicted dienelactone hydrolase
VAGFGFIVVVPNQKSTMIIAPGLYAQENKVNDVLSFMRSENNRSNSPLNQKIDINTMVLLGHSYGGVASLYVIQGSCQYPFCIGFAFHRPNALKGGAFYGTNLKGPIGPIPALDNHGLPICLIQGSRDSLATPAETEETYYGIKDSPKAYIIVKGANHYGITDLNNPPGAKPDKNVPLISQQEAVEIIGRVAALFLHDYALSDENA